MTYERIPTFYITFINCDTMVEHTIAMAMQPGFTVDGAREYFIKFQPPESRILVVSVYDADYIDELYTHRSPVPNEIVRYLGYAPESLDTPETEPEPEGEPYTDRDNDPANWGAFDNWRDPRDSGKSDQDDEDTDGEEWKKLL